MKPISKNVLVAFLLALFWTTCHTKSDCECGMEEPEIPGSQSPIVAVMENGQDFPASKYPWTTFIRLTSPYEGVWKRCTGILISRQHIITAAYCVTNHRDDTPFSPSNLAVYLDIHHTSSAWIGFGYGVEKITIAEGYKYGGKELFHNIAILTLREKIEFSKKIHPICMPKSGEKNIINHSDLTMVGWTSYFWGYSASHALLNYIEPEECREHGQI
ncbi:venom serine protease-like [Brevipalpus obovatus]|uniref:venom serine protease-like n=1 Tax=Brevipalpus obovatus TaxID=246614 RepID=UPI003D9E1560